MNSLEPTVIAERERISLTLPAELTKENIEKRVAGVKPNFDCVHRCSQCGERYLCPDRYTMPLCVPSEHFIEKGMEVPLMMCLPCAAHVTTDERKLWYEAHGLREAEHALSR